MLSLKSVSAKCLIGSCAMFFIFTLCFQNPCYSTDLFVESGTNTWITNDALDPDGDGIIYWNDNYSNNFGSGSHVKLYHEIRLDGENGSDDTDGDIWWNGQGGYSGLQPDAQLTGSEGEDGYNFTITADTVTFGAYPPAAQWRQNQNVRYLL